MEKPSLISYCPSQWNVLPLALQDTVMKKNILFIFLLFFSICSFAQDDKITDGPSKNNKYELGLNLFSITNVGFQKADPSNESEIDIYDFTSYNVPSGLYVKLHSGKNALRLSYDYFQRRFAAHSFTDLSNIIYEIPVDNSYDYHYNGIKKDHEFKVGYQRTMGKKRFTGFFSADLVFNYNKFYGTQTVTWHPSEVVGTVPFYHERYNAGIAIGGGLSYKITKRLNIIYEFSVAGIYTRKKESANKNRDWGNEQSLKLNPVRMLGVGYLF